MRFRVGLISLLCCSACATRGPERLSTRELQSLGEFRTDRPYDETYDATWLALEALGFRVRDWQRVQGFLETDAVDQPDGTRRSWRADFSQAGAQLTVTLVPKILLGEQDVTAEHLFEPKEQDAVWAKVTPLLAAWTVHPDIAFQATRGEVDLAGLRLLLPPTWEHFDFATDRRTLAVQKTKGVKGFNPTVVYRLERTRPRPELARLVHEALEKSWGAVVEEPTGWEEKNDVHGVSAEGEVLVGTSKSPRQAWWRRWEARSPAWVARVAVSCAPAGAELSCDAEALQVIDSAGDTNGRLVNATGAVPTFQSR